MSTDGDPVDAGAVAAAYSDVGGGWADGPERIYGRLALDLVARCPGGVEGRTALDLGAGTGAASNALVAAGARRVVAVDVALGMLLHARHHRPAAVVGDARQLPFSDRSFEAVIAAFSLNHLSDPAAGLAEVGRVLEHGGSLVASAYADDDTHPVKDAVDAACRARGWEPPPWYEGFRGVAAPLLATPDSAGEAADTAGLSGAAIDRAEVPFPDLAAADLVAWRLGMAQVAAFVGSLSAEGRTELADDAIGRLGSFPELVRRFVVISWVKPRP